MTIDFNFLTILLLALIAQGIFASIVLVFKVENKSANRYLSLLIFLLALWLTDSFFRTGGVYRQDPDFYFLPIYFSLGFGPLIYFYTRTLTRANFRLTSRDWLHLVPVVIQGSFYIYLQTRDYAYRRNFWYEVHRPYLYDVELVLSFGSILLYLVASRWQIERYKQKIKNAFSSTHRITLNWLAALHFILAMLAFFWLLESLVRLIWNYYPATPLSAMTIGLTVLIMAAGGILQKDLSAVTSDFPKRSGSESEIDQHLVRRIQTIMQDQELFLRQELTLKEFALEVGAGPRAVSQAINQGLGMRFIDFVNSYRVERVKALIDKEQMGHLNLTGIALESGFNAKSTFNRVFKKMTGQRPSEYQKKAQNT